MTNPDVIYETIILGSGPAGLTAAIYAGRSRCCPLLIHGVQPGGQLTTTTAVDNFPGFPEGIDGPDLMENMRQQAERFGAQFVEGEVTRVDLQERPFRIWTGEEMIPLPDPDYCHRSLTKTARPGQRASHYTAAEYRSVPPATDFSIATVKWSWSVAVTLPWRKPFS